MKHSQLYSLLLFLALSCPSHAQFFERNFQPDFYNQVMDMRRGGQGELFVTTATGEQTSFQTVFMHRIDHQGKDTTFPMLSYGLPLDYDWIPVSGGFIVTGNFFECDLSLPRRYFRYDTTGTLLWEKEAYPFWAEFYTDTVKLLPGPGDSFWSFNGGKPKLYDLNGDSIGIALFPLPLFKGYVTDSDGNFLTYGDGLARYNPALSSIHTGLPGFFVVKADVLPGGRCAVLTADKLLVLDANFEIQKEINHGISISSGIQTDMAVKSNEIWLLSATVPKQLLRYDTALVLQETTTVPANASFQPTRLTLDEQRIAMAGEEYGLPATQVAGVRSTAVSNIRFDATADAALLDVTSDSLPVGSYFFTPSAGFYSIVFENVYVTLKNEGAEPLQEVVLNTVLGYIAFFCPTTLTYQRHFTGLNLLPGESTVLGIGEIIQEGSFNLPTETTLCFWTTLPNDSLDQNRLNNSFCKDFTVIVGIEEPQQVLPLRITPNPATDFFRIQWPGDFDTEAVVRLYDAAGRIIDETRVSGSEWTFQRESLSAGLYQVVLRDQNGRVYSGKVIFD